MLSGIRTPRPGAVLAFFSLTAPPESGEYNTVFVAGLIRFIAIWVGVVVVAKLEQKRRR